MGRFLRTAAVVALVAALGSTAALATCRTETFTTRGITFRHPSWWHVTTKPLSNGSSPDYRFAVTTWPVRRTPRDQGPCLAGVRKQRPADGVLAFIREEVGAARKRSLRRVSPRPERFRLPTRTDGDFGCLGRGSLAYVFKEQRRVFYLWISIGPKASAETRRELRRILHSLEILPLGT
jgi:hypothetical protein